MITHPEKLLFPEDGITKAELAAFYALAAPAISPHLRGRPITMERYPQGTGAKGFFQMDVSRGFPVWLPRVEVPKQGGTVHHPLIEDERALAWMANQNCITPHVWNRRLPDLERPDLCVFDLDPALDFQPVRFTWHSSAVSTGRTSWASSWGQTVPGRFRVEIDDVRPE